MVAVETAHAAWTALTNMFSSHSRSLINNLRITLSNAEKGTQSVAVYFAKMRSFADELAVAGKPLGEDELISYILAGLDLEYNPLVSALDARTEPLTLDALYSQMANFDQRVELLQASGKGGFRSSANAATRGRGQQRGRGMSRGRGGGRGGHGRGSGGASPGYNNNRGGRPGPGGLGGPAGGGFRNDNRPHCQICSKPGHVAMDSGTGSRKTIFQKRRWPDLQQAHHMG